MPAIEVFDRWFLALGESIVSLDEDILFKEVVCVYAQT